jgi:hypothetical protein
MRTATASIGRSSGLFKRAIATKCCNRLVARWPSASSGRPGAPELRQSSGQEFHFPGCQFVDTTNDAEFLVLDKRVENRPRRPEFLDV